MIKNVMFLLLFSIIGGQVWANCDAMMEEIDDSALLVAFLVKTHGERTISDDDLEHFYVNLLDGKFINPVKHKQTKYGPTFRSSTLYSAYYAFDVLLKNRSLLDKDVIEKKITDYRNELVKIKTERGRLEVETNANLKLERTLNFLTEKREGSTLYYFILNSGIFLEKDAEVYSRLIELLKESDQVDFNFDGYLMSQILTKDVTFKEMIQMSKVNKTFSSLFFQNLNQYIKNISIDELINGFIENESFFDRNDLIEMIIKKIGKNKKERMLLFYKDKYVEYQEVDVFRSLAYLEGIYHLSGDFIFFEQELYKNKKILLYFQNFDAPQELKRKDYVQLISKIIMNEKGDLLNLAIRDLGLFRYHFYKDKETIPLVKMLIEKNMIEMKSPEDILCLSGIDEDWALDLIEKKLFIDPKSNENSIRSLFKYESLLVGMSSRRSLEMIERLIEKALKGDYKNDFDLFFDYRSMLRGRPKKDLLYFLKKYDEKMGIGQMAAAALFDQFKFLDDDVKKFVLDKMITDPFSWKMEFSEKFVKSLPLNEKETFLTNWMNYDLAGDGNGSIRLHDHLRGIYSIEVYNYLRAKISNMEEVDSFLMSHYLTHFFIAYGLRKSQNPDEAKISEFIVNDFYLKNGQYKFR